MTSVFYLRSDSLWFFVAQSHSEKFDLDRPCNGENNTQPTSFSKPNERGKRGHFSCRQMLDCGNSLNSEVDNILQESLWPKSVNERFVLAPRKSGKVVIFAKWQRFDRGQASSISTHIWVVRKRDHNDHHMSPFCVTKRECCQSSYLQNFPLLVNLSGGGIGERGRHLQGGPGVLH